MLTLLLSVAIVAPAPAAAPESDPVAVMSEALVVPLAQRGGRVPFHVDEIEARIVAGAWSAPQAGDTVVAADGSTRAWHALAAAENGWLRHEDLRNGYASWTVERDAPGVAMLVASGHSLVYAGDGLRAGDPYQNGWVRVPVRLEAGANELLFRVARGGLRARLEPPRAPVFLDPVEATLPDLIAEETRPVLAGVLLVNATEHELDGLVVRTSGDGIGVMETRVAPLGPLSTRKIPMWIDGNVGDGLESVAVRAEIVSERPHGVGAGLGRAQVDAIDLTLRVRSATGAHRRTFQSTIDGSVQYYAVMPASEDAPEEARPGLILTLHGASVEGYGQMSTYAPKPWAHVVAPTNRRPFGFDWEDWGRLDAMEVLTLAQARLDTDPARTWLTGHSMGGHGTWHLGVTFPGLWAAVGPSAGWVSFWSYTGAADYDDPTPVEAILRRAAAPSDTLLLKENLLDLGVYILHGDADDNVPVDQARLMRDELAPIHPDLAYHEQPGAGHWWGNRCTDWPPMMEFMRERAREPRDRIRFATVHPGVSAASGWVRIEQQRVPMEVSRVDAGLDRVERRFRVETENVAAVALRTDGLEPGPLAVEIDGHVLADIEWPQVTGAVRVLRGNDGGWTATIAHPDGRAKGPHRAGPFKDAFRNRAALVYGTRGNAEENAWAHAKARYDAQTFWYRGNGAFEVMSDEAFLERGGDDRNVVLYGNADTNAAWEDLLPGTPVSVGRGAVRIGDRVLEGEAWAALVVRPHPRSPLASVAAVSGSGLPGMRLTDRLPYFVSGVAYPDWVVFGPDVLEAGTAAVMGAGFFGNDWSLDQGVSGWRD